MLWSDPENEPPKDMRDAQAMVRRMTVVLLLAMLVAIYVLGVGPF
ncbi:morphogenic membrane protein MmpB [Streptomyces nojiriensis]